MRWTVLINGGWALTWHSYTPPSRSVAERKSNRQSFGFSRASENLESLAYVSKPIVSKCSSSPRLRTHDTWNQNRWDFQRTIEKNERRVSRLLTRFVGLNDITVWRSKNASILSVLALNVATLHVSQRSYPNPRRFTLPDNESLDFYFTFAHFLSVSTPTNSTYKNCEHSATRLVVDTVLVAIWTTILILCNFVTSL